ncbi:MAG TPA: VOC family protein [Acidimicrobiales bacterium]|jgi:catechol 2,3-dioxygenase-like lactoylglutathione lyase family enzyme
MLRLRNVTFMSRHPERLADFWAAALGWPERRTWEDEIVVADAEWGFPRLTVQTIDDERSAPGAVHLDITADDRVAEVARLRGLGATEDDTHEVDGFRWTIMRDPDGNEFCVTDP